MAGIHPSSSLDVQPPLAFRICSHVSLDFKIAPCVKGELDKAAQSVVEVCEKLREDPW